MKWLHSRIGLLHILYDIIVAVQIVGCPPTGRAQD